MTMTLSWRSRSSSEVGVGYWGFSVSSFSIRRLDMVRVNLLWGIRPPLGPAKLADYLTLIGISVGFALTVGGLIFGAIHLLVGF